ncbi:hypothetical protein HYPDE_24753 [Hyphomicrobium denitrificans 1NES1]|uniref:Uncharacterized protein n=1 Tax=Hyphomicrobium denitrificans 1NES1 TaxID=670307 RepID=N0B997_9HYPH|nr:hypothetical protein [Hyphomicrobium denitrificans]AGK56635.1 hypothetical protein HYPDE_24753 [Hyphomicrobium denitrificans 1NES1]
MKSRIATGALILALFVLILSKSKLAYLVAGNFHLIAAFQASSPAIRFALGNEVIAESPLQGLNRYRKKQIWDWISSSLRDEPFNARGLEIMGLLAADNANTAMADQFMSIAVRQSLRRQSAAYWILRKKMAARDYAAAAGYADALLRARPQPMPLIIAVLTTMAETPNAREALIKLLAEDPPWRSSFFSHLKGHIRNPYVPLRLLLALIATPHPPTSREIGDYLRLLLDNKLYRLSYYCWLQFLSSTELGETGLLSNGAFEFAPSGLPYDWKIASGDGATIEIAPRDDRPADRALSIELGPGRVDFHPVSQLLGLPPGRYTLSGSFEGSIRGRRGLIWQIGCLPKPRTVAKTEMFLGDVRQWRRFTVVFEVPMDCIAQTLELILDARSASETIVSGFARFDDLTITRK